MVARTWEELRSQTEGALVQLAHEGYTVLIKPHPQQNQRGETRRWRALSGALWGNAIQLLDPDLDTRYLILNADIVIGFQTTALFESLAAGKPVIYTFWSEPARRYAQDLIPFHQAGDALYCVTSPEELTRVVKQCRGAVADPGTVVQRRRFFEEYLGPLDGDASRRAWRHIEALTAQRAPSSARRDLDARAAAYCRHEATRASWRAWSAKFLAELALLAYPGWQIARRFVRSGETELPPSDKFRENLRARARFMAQRARDCRAIAARQ
jgi:CDP-glycerol glycerophosphotransferase (TagB/SpsB family)